MAETCKGWILDAYIEYDEVVLWVKTIEGNALKLVDKYNPSIFLLPKTENAGRELVQIFSDLELVMKTQWVDKFIDVNDNITRKLIQVRCHSILHYNLLLKALQHHTFRQRVQCTYHTKISHIHRYNFEKLPKNTMAKVRVEHDNGDLVSIEEITEPETLEIPFSAMYANVAPTYGQTILDGDDPIESIQVKIDNEIIEISGHESDILQKFSAYVKNKDPDIIVFNYESIIVLNYLIQRVKSNSLDIPLGRRIVDMYSGDSRIVNKWGQGRIYLYDQQIESNGLEGLIELSRFSGLPIGSVKDQSIGRLISYRNIHELLSKDYVISDSISETFYEQIRTVEEIIKYDKAGMIFSPKVGLHENVAVLDYNDEFANIIINENISYERNGNLGLRLLPQIVKSLVERRVYFKQLLKKLPADSSEVIQCQRRNDICKQILVSLYGTTGSFWNKYGNIIAFEEINKKSREILLKTKDIIQDYGFELIYSDTDACFVHKSSATKEDYKKLGDTVSKETRLALSLEYHYKFLVLLPLEADQKLEALKHYFGITYDGDLVMRGIETRRHDAPKFIKDFQTELLYTLFDCEKIEEICNRTLENTFLCVTRTIDKVMTNGVNIEDLVISKLLRMEITKYRNLFPHVAAAIQSSNQNSKPPTKGNMIRYIYTDSQHQNPLKRVVTFDGSLEHVEYDKEKYKEMLLDAADTVLGIFNFDRTVYGKANDRKWWLELKRNRMQDIQAESEMNLS